MNTRFSYNLLQVFSKKRPAGFALPMVVMMGTVVLVVGAAMMVKGMNDQNQVTSQKAKMVANNAAETGMTRLQETLVTRPNLATVPLEQWKNVIAAYDSNPDSVILMQTSGLSSGVVSAIQSFDQAASDLQSESCEYAAMDDPDVKEALIEDIRNLIGDGTFSAKQLPNVSNSSGQPVKYRIKSYLYDPGTQKGSVVVRGIVGTGTNAARSEITASFPVVESTQQNIPTSAFPGLWVKERLQIGQNDSQPGRLEANVAYDCGIQAGTLSTSAGNGQTNGYTKYLSAATVGSRKAISVALPAGSPAPQETNIPMPNPPTSAPSGVTAVSVGNINDDLTLPRTSDNTSSANYQASTQTYYYTASDIDLGNNESLVFTPGRKVVLFVTGDIEIGGGGAIAHNINACPTGSTCDATNVRILGSTANTDGTFETGGNASVCSIFFWAPTYSVDMSGGGHAGDCPTGANQNGIYWVKEWIGGGQGNHTALVQNSSNWSNIFGLPYDILKKTELSAIENYGNAESPYEPADD